MELEAFPVQSDLPIQDGRIAALWRHWLAVRGGRAMPARQDIDPMALGPTLPHLYIYDFERQSGRFFCRLAGEEIQAGSGIRGSRRYLDEMFPAEIAAPIVARYRRVVDGPSIVYARGPMRSAAGHVMPIERLVLPLSGDGTAANGLIGSTLYRREEALSALLEPPPLAPESFFALPPAEWAPPR
ncbi:MAG: PAS domain-containing protein [Alphaproteobacteria bacterium]|nr:PAS domain-containing protein [Alphaproteobacteria bacterium]